VADGVVLGAWLELVDGAALGEAIGPNVVCCWFVHAPAAIASVASIANRRRGPRAVITSTLRTAADCGSGRC
jgi:hypothetical protein